MDLPVHLAGHHMLRGFITSIHVQLDTILYEPSPLADRIILFVR